MAEPTFSDYIAAERERLRSEHTNIVRQQQTLEKRLAEIAREMKAITAYERMKSGKPTAPAGTRAAAISRAPAVEAEPPPPAPAAPKAAAPATAARTVPPASAAPKKKRNRTKRVVKAQSKGDRVLDLVQENPAGLTRGQIIEKLGAKGDKVWEQSISNSLANLKRRNKLINNDGKYVTA